MNPHVRLRGGPYDGNLCVPFDRGAGEAVPAKRAPALAIGESEHRYRRVLSEADDQGNPIYVYEGGL